MKRPRKFTVVIERDEDGYYVATVPSLRGCHTQAKNLDTLMKRTREVIELCLEDGEGQVGTWNSLASNRSPYDSSSSLNEIVHPAHCAATS